MNGGTSPLRQRLLAVADLEAVCAIESSVYPHPWSRGNFVDSMAAGYHCIGLFDATEGLVAYLVAMDGHEETHLLNIAVDAACQSRGHARTLLDALVDRARALAAATVWLEVRPSNARARALYERYGFEEVGRRRDYYPAADGRREDAVVMRLDVPVAPRVSAVARGVTDAVD